MLGVCSKNLTVLRIAHKACVHSSFSFSSKKLVPWLRLIFRCETLLEIYYQSWSYVAKTGMDVTILLNCLKQL